MKKFELTESFKINVIGVTVVCGCFTGTLDEFAAKVQETHGDSRYGREYRTIIEVIKIKFGMEK